MRGSGRKDQAQSIKLKGRFKVQIPTRAVGWGWMCFFPNREDLFPGCRGATVLECGDLSSLLRRRLVAVELWGGSGHAGGLALARAVNAPFRLHASRNLTATSRLAKALTSHRTPQSRSSGCGSPSLATFDRSPRLPATVAPRESPCCCCDPHDGQRPRPQWRWHARGGRMGEHRTALHLAAPGDGRTPAALWSSA